MKPSLNKNAIILTGQKFGRLTVSDRWVRTPSNKLLWDCVCECGSVALIFSCNLTGGKTQSCGCLARELAAVRLKTHGMEGTRVYRIWKGMHARCRLPNNPAYPDYGGRGIKVCPAWQSFEHFLSDMGEPRPGLEIERINNDGNYEPLNCKWATRREQANNRRNNHRIILNGRDMTITQAARLRGMDPRKVFSRIYNGWTPSRALEIM